MKPQTEPSSRTYDQQLLAMFALALLCGCGVPVEDDFYGEDEDDLVGEVPVERIEQHLQSAVGGSHVSLDMFNNKHRSTGVLFIPWSPDGAIWGSCGVTFISPHYAITAAHCVPTQKAPLDQLAFFVYNYSVDELALRIVFGGDTALANKFVQSQQVTGSWPNYTQGARLTANDGYREAGWGAGVCRVRVRCSKTYGKDRCPFIPREANGGEGTDIALIECPYRPTWAPWTTVVSGGEVAGQDVEVHWSHELLNLSVYQGDGIGPAGNWNHYGRYDGTDGYETNYGKLDNHHYANLTSNQFLPLVSRSFSGGAYKTLSSTGWGDTERWTNLYGCHGTSGSGVFPQNSDQLLGPVAHGGAGLSGRLCANPSAITASSASLSFVRPYYTRLIEAMSYVQNDR